MIIPIPSTVTKPRATIPHPHSDSTTLHSLQQEASCRPPLGNPTRYPETPTSRHHTLSANIASPPAPAPPPRSFQTPMLVVAAHAMPFTYSRPPTAIDLIYSTQDFQLPAPRPSWGLDRSFVSKDVCCARLCDVRCAKSGC